MQEKSKKSLLCEIIELNYNKLQEICYLATGDKSKAGDLLHTTLESILTSDTCTANLQSAYADGSAMSYLRRAIYLQAHGNRSKYRALFVAFDRRTFPLFEETTGDPATEPPPPWMGGRLDNEFLDGCIDMLPEFDAELYRLYILPGFSYDDVSQATGIPKSALYRSIKQSTKKLRDGILRKQRRAAAQT